MQSEEFSSVWLNCCFLEEKSFFQTGPDDPRTIVHGGTAALGRGQEWGAHEQDGVRLTRHFAQLPKSLSAVVRLLWNHSSCVWNRQQGL